MSPAARAQRRGAARKHGGYAQTALGQVLTPCLRSKCTLGADHYPCPIRQTMDDRDATLEHCPLPLVLDEEVVRRVKAAIDENDPSKVSEFQARALAAAMHLRDTGLAELQRDGLTIQEAVIVDDEVRTDIARFKAHPSAETVLKLLALTGATAEQQAITPKARGEKARDEGIGTLVDFLREKNRALLPAPAPEAGS
jgi:hypothetical protein